MAASSAAVIAVKPFRSFVICIGTSRIGTSHPRRRPTVSTEPCALACQFLLYRRDIQIVERLVTTQRDGGGGTRSLARDGAAHHVARRGVRYVVAADAASGNQQVADALGHERTIRHMPVPARRRQDQDAVAVDEFGEDADRIV